MFYSDSIYNLKNEISDILYDFYIDENPDICLNVQISDTDESIIIKTNLLLAVKNLITQMNDGNNISTLHYYLWEILRFKLNNQWFNNGKFIIMEYDNCIRDVFYIEY